MKRNFILAFSLFASLSLAAQNTEIKSSLDSTFQDPFSLDQLVVTATRTHKKLKDVPVITQVITAKQIEERGISTIQDLLTQEVPGINFHEVGFGTSIDLQGLGSKHILFLIDGERIAGENGGNIDYSRINMYNVDRIEIVKGASSALYGSQAMGGVINVITKKVKNKIEVNGGVRYAQNNQTNYHHVDKDDFYHKAKKNVDKPNLNTNLSVGAKLGGFSTQTDFLYKSADAYQLYDKKGYTKYFPEYDITVDVPLDESPYSISGYEDIQVSEKLGYKFNDKFKVSLHGTFYQLNKYDFNFDNVFEQSKDFSYGGNLEYKFNENSILSASVHADDYKRANKFEKMSGSDLIYKNRVIQPRLMYTNSMLKDQVISAGLEYYRESLYGDKFDTEDYYEGQKYMTKSQWYGTFFVQDDYTINKQFSVIAGLRGDYHEKYGTNVTPKVSFMFKKVPFTVRLNYARGYRSPTIKELYMNWDHLGMFQIIGNSELDPESNHYVSLSGEYSNRWININVNVYGNWFKDKIEGLWKDGEYTDENGVTKERDELHYINVGKSHLAGVEAMCKIKVCRNLFLHGSYNYLYTSKDENGVRLSSSAPHSGMVRAEFKTFVNKFQTTVNLTGNITGAKDFHVLDDVMVDGVEKEGYYKMHLGAYSMWNLTVAQQIFKNFRITLGIDNVFDYEPDMLSFNSSSSPGRIFFTACNFSF